MNVVIDRREPELFHSLFSEEDRVSTAQLACGDFLVDGQWLFERKNDPCLSRSLRSFLTGVAAGEDWSRLINKWSSAPGFVL